MDYSKYGKIDDEGAIIMGNLFCADGYHLRFPPEAGDLEAKKNFFAISHMHTDHASKLKKMLYNGSVYMTDKTQKLLEAINDDNYSEKTTQSNIGKNQIHAIRYDKKESVKGTDGIEEWISFHHSNHTLGASQIEINTHDEKTIVYSGDVTGKDKPPDNIDLLIVDATHGHPRYDRYNDEKSDERKLLNAIEERVHKETPQHIVIHAHEGKIQEAMALISNHKPLSDFPLVANAKDRRMANVYRDEPEFSKLRKKIIDTEEVELMLDDDSAMPFIEFTAHCGKKSYELKEKAFSIYLTDKCDQQTNLNEDKNTLMLVTHSHAGNTELLDYVKGACPSKVIVDASRSKQGPDLTDMLRSNKFNAEYQPV